MSSQTPECSKWSIWVGQEIEGAESDLGKRTLFVRHGNYGLTEKYAKLYDVERIWFCKEFFVPRGPRCEVVTRFVGKYDVAVEVTPDMLEWLPREVIEKTQIFLKIPAKVNRLKPTDFVCVGPPFSDVLFEIGTGLQMRPKQYNDDIQLI